MSERCHESHVEFIAGASNGALAAKDAIAALPADRRWEDLRAWIVARQAKAESYRQWDDLWSMFDLVLDKMDRIAPPADGAENT